MADNGSLDSGGIRAAQRPRFLWSCRGLIFWEGYASTRSGSTYAAQELAKPSSSLCLLQHIRPTCGLESTFPAFTQSLA